MLSTFTGRFKPEFIMGATPHEDLVGIYEIAEMAGKSRQAVANWRARLSNFPKPVAELKAGPVFNRSEVKAWLDVRNGQAAPIEPLITKRPDVVSIDLRGAQMSQSNMSRHTKRILMAGGGLAAIVVGVIVVGRISPMHGASIMGTIVPAERYHSSQVSNADVQLGDTGVAQVMQTDMYERMVKDPEFRKQVANQAANQASNVASAMKTDSVASAMKADSVASAMKADSVASAMKADSVASAMKADSVASAMKADSVASAMKADSVAAAQAANTASSQVRQ